MMILKECLLQTNWSAVNADLCRLFPEFVEYMASYQAAYEELDRTKPEVGNTRITIGRFEPNSVLPFYIVGFNGECPKGYCLKFIPWQRWLGLHIDPSLHDQYQHSEIVAICLYDMSWAGFRSDEVESFRREFIHHENCLWAIYAHEEAIKSSEFNPIKRKQRSNEFNEALNLHDIDDVCWVDNESTEYRQARFEMEVQMYCLGETETDYEDYCAKVVALREDFQLRWPDPSSNHPNVH